jgi:osmotically-inducible protein OsmY
VSQDSQLKEAILAELRWEPRIVAGHIGVSARSGAVTLTGHVESFTQKLAAEVATRRVKGVKAMAEELEVKLPYDMRRGDTDIASAWVERLAWDISVPKNRVTVQVEKGWVTLTGDVDWPYQKDAAAQDIHHLLWVVGVSNQITSKPRVNTSVISDDIMHALHRSWFFDPKTANVTADAGHIRLTGTVHSWHDRQVAAEAAWAAAGATDVENDLTIL